ncbi:putative quinol monooxygenase [Ligilactobacillus equi]|uniref:putative quinol monooxygenase n=1 Tax=Ligilactobacillus equi TaxID=137357 RepID=UPI000469C2FF|nr:antibiotic biosynthesis monooxygenase [Ligilactobacillus equi]
MALTINIYYRGQGDNAKKFAQEMTDSGIVAEIRSRQVILGYDYFYPSDDPQTVLLIDSWQDQASLDAHHQTETMAKIAALREKYDLHMTVERYQKLADNADDAQFIRN